MNTLATTAELVLQTELAAEVVPLIIDDIQQRHGLGVIVDMADKGNRVRSVPIPSWAKLVIDEWTKAALGLTKSNCRSAMPA